MPITDVFHAAADLGGVLNSAYTHRSVFQGVGRTPQTDENTVLLNFRYYPFQ